MARQDDHSVPGSPHTPTNIMDFSFYEDPLDLSPSTSELDLTLGQAGSPGTSRLYLQSLTLGETNNFLGEAPDLHQGALPLFINTPSGHGLERPQLEQIDLDTNLGPVEFTGTSGVSTPSVLPSPQPTVSSSSHPVRPAG